MNPLPVEIAVKTDRAKPRWRWEVQAPSWLVSMVVHMLLVIVLGLVAVSSTRGPGDRNHTFGMSLASSTSESDYYDDDTSGMPTVSVQSANAKLPPTNDAAAGVAGVIQDSSPVDIRGSLPKAADLIGPGGNGANSATGASGFTQGPAQSNRVSGGKARTKLYGLSGEGYKFVYVFDRSASMGNGPLSPLNSAKNELLASIETLGETHQFQIIFYNEHATMFPLAGAHGRLVFGNEPNKKSAERFVRGIIADGGTSHEEALEMALSMYPDVIYFLTDADQPALSPNRLFQIQRRNGGRTSINTIEFGLGPGGQRDNFLVQLARENGGAYAYIDVSQPQAARVGVRE